jgi:hypothetical protein
MRLNDKKEKIWAATEGGASPRTMGAQTTGTTQ